MPAITVIMPSLNVVKYIRSCIESVLAQTLQDLEILAVDAGSEDGTLEILEEYAALDERVKVIHSDRKSYGYQLNLGIKHAQGEYVGIVETDDKILSDMYKTLYHTALETDAEYVKGRAAFFTEMGNGAEWDFPLGMPLANRDMAGKVIIPRDMPELLVRDIYLWTGIYKKEFVRQIRLNETPGAAFQDQGFLFQTISSAEKAVYLDKVVYQYRQDNGDSSIRNKKGFHYLVEEYSYIEKFLVDKDERWMNVYYQRMLNQCLGRFRMMAASDTFWEEALPDMEILRERLWKAEKNKLLKVSDIDYDKNELLRMFFKGAGELYIYYLEIFQKQEKAFYDILQAVNHQQVIIFGCGKIGKFFHNLLESRESGLTVAFCDNNCELWNTKLQGNLILRPEEAVKKYPDAVYVITSKYHADEIMKQLCLFGIGERNILLYIEEVDLRLLKKRVLEEDNVL